jgi:hypothetical protein
MAVSAGFTVTAIHKHATVCSNSYNCYDRNVCFTPSSGMWCHVVLVRTNGSKKHITSLVLEAIRSSETSVLTRATWRQIPEDGILHSHRREKTSDLTSVLHWKSAQSAVCMQWICCHHKFLKTEKKRQRYELLWHTLIVDKSWIL